jgi:hypothetical protein
MIGKNFDRSLKTLKPVGVVALATITLLLIGSTIASADSVGIHDQVDSSAFGYSEKFRSIQEVQDVVPFTIRTPSILSSKEFRGGRVEIIPSAKQDDLVLVHLIYHLPSGQTLMLMESNRPPNPSPIEIKEDQSDVWSLQPVQVADVPGWAASGTNLAGTRLGSVYWIADGVTFYVIALEATGLELVPLAASVMN